MTTRENQDLPNECYETMIQELFSAVERIKTSRGTLNEMIAACGSDGEPQMIAACRIKNEKILLETIVLIKSFSNHLLKIPEESIYLEYFKEIRNELLEFQILQMQLSFNLKQMARGKKKLLSPRSINPKP